MSRTNVLLFSQDSVVEDSLFVIREIDSLTLLMRDSLALLEPIRYDGVGRELIYANSVLSFPILLFVVFNLIALALSSHWILRSVKRSFFVREKINRSGKISVWIDYATQYFFFFQALLLSSYYSVALFSNEGFAFWDLPFDRVAVYLGLAILFIMMWTLLRQCLLLFLDWHMQLKGRMREVRLQIFHVFSLLGVVLFFISLFVIFDGLNLGFASNILIVLIVVCCISIILRSFFCFFESRFFILYLILYLCAAEIIPLSFLVYCFGQIGTFYLQ